MSNIINLKQTRKNIEQSLAIINQDEPLSKQIRFQHLHTLSKIIYIQSCRLAHYAGIGILHNTELKAEQIACNKPKCYLAKSCQVTTKTIQNHIKRLEEKQLIKRINKDGKLLLIVHPLLLSIYEQHDKIRAVLWENFKSINPLINNSLENDRGKTFPTNNLSRNFKSKITSDVEMLKSQSQPRSQDSKQETFQETQKTKHPENQNQQIRSELNTNHQIRKPEPGGRQKSEQEFIEKQVQNIWQWCTGNLYSDRKFLSESQHEYAIDFLTRSFDLKHGPAVYKHISTLRTRLFKWKKFVNKTGTVKRFTPLPTNFFNPDNIHGFVKTDLWIKEAQHSERYNQIWKQARQIERTALQILTGNRPEKWKDPINQKTETRYRPFTTKERLTELHKLEYRVNRISEKFPSINKWYRNRLQEIIDLTNGQIAV